MKKLWLVFFFFLYAVYTPLVMGAQSPVNPNATQPAKDLLNWLSELKNRPNTRVVSGQEVGPNQSAWTLFYDAVYNQTGRYLGLVGIDAEWNGWGLPASQNGIRFDQWWIDKCAWHWNLGGLVTIHWHCHNPWNDGTVDDNTGSGGTAMEQLITSGSSVYSKWMVYLDKLAAGLQQFEDAGVVILWRPFHENGFWWGNQNESSSYIKVWQHMFNYFTYTKGLNNLLWVYSPNVNNYLGKSALSRYPGDAYVDICGVDYYPQTSTFGTVDIYSSFVGKGKVMAMTEYGYRGSGQVDNLNVINSIQNSNPLWTYIMYWNDWSDRSYSLTSNINAAGFMDHSWIIDRSEISLTTNTVAAPVISPAGGIFRNSVSVTLSTTTSGATIHYTTNGTNPTTSSTQYAGAFNLTASATVKAMAGKSGMTNSSITSAVFTRTEGTNVALNKPATASSIEGAGYEASRAFDGNAATRWSSNFLSDLQWLQVDLQEVYTIDAVVLKWEAAYAGAYQIQVSQNGTDWADIYSTTAGGGGVETIRLTPVTARYVRVNMTARGTPYYYSLWEFEVYGTGAIAVDDRHPFHVTAITTMSIYPNPLTRDALIRIMQQGGGEVSNLAGRPVDLNRIRDNGIYFIVTEGQVARKIVVIK